MDEVERLKKAGNACFEAKDAATAIDLFTEALGHDSRSHILHSNRAAAFMMAARYDEALADANACIEVDPGFAKGYSRKMQALLALGRPSEAVEAGNAAAAANSGLQDSSKMSLKVVEALKRQAQQSLLMRTIRGQWRGEVSAKMGGYSQHFNFVDDDTVITTVLGKAIAAKYTLKLPATDMPLHLDLSVPGDAGTFGETPTVPYIARLSHVSESKPVEYRGLTHHPGRNDQCCLDWQLELCCPFLSSMRPDAFEGDGYCVMKACDGEIPYGKKIDHDVEEMCFSSQLYRYYQELKSIKLSKPLVEAQITDSDELAAEKITRFMRAQNDVFELSRRFPNKAIEYAEIILRACGDDPAMDAQLIPGEIDERDLKRAKQLLQSLPNSVKEIAEETRARFFASGLFRIHLLPEASPPPRSALPPTISAAENTIGCPAFGIRNKTHGATWRRFLPITQAQWITAAAVAAATAGAVWFICRRWKSKTN